MTKVRQRVIWQCGALSLALMCSGGCSGIRTLHTAGVPTLTVADLTAGGESGPLSRIAHGQAAIIHFAAGDAVPLELEANLPFASLEAGHNVIRFQREVYLYIAHDTFAISPDMQRWANISDMHAIRDLFGARSGTFQIGFGAHAGQPLMFHVAAGWR